MAKSAAETDRSNKSLGQISLPPHSTEAEAALIGGLIMDPNGEAYDKIADLVSDRDFYHPENKAVFIAIQELREDSKVTDVLTVSDYLDSNDADMPESGIEYLSEIIETTAGSSNVTEYAKIIREKALLRELIQISNDISQNAYKPEGRTPTELVDIAESYIFEIAERGTKQGTFAQMSDLVKETYDELDKRSQGGGGLTGVSSGFRELDNLTAGLQKGELIIIAGRPSMGKTAFALNIGAIQQIKDAPSYIDDAPSLTPIELRARARRIQREKGLSLILIDYLQLMQVHGNKENRATEISEISRNLKALARELNVPIIALSQLNRSVEQRTDKVPQMSDLRESGAIEQDADLIAFIYREEVYDPETDKKGIAQINVAKQRNGAIGKFNLTWVGRYTKFENWSPEYEQF